MAPPDDVTKPSPQAFLQRVIKQRHERRQQGNVDQPLVGSGVLPSGWHAVSVAAVDTSMVESRGLLGVTFSTGTLMHQERWFILTRDKSRLAPSICYLLYGLFAGSTQAEDALLDEVDTDVHAWQIMRGMGLHILIAPSAGHEIMITSGGYLARDAKTHVVLTAVHKSVGEARAAAEAAGHKRSFHRVEDCDVASDHNNIDALNNAIQGRRNAPTTAGHSTILHLRRFASNLKT